MTALALAYPLVTMRYFWEDWFRFYKWGAPMLVEPVGLIIRATDGRLTFLSPWRLLEAAVASVLLASAAKRLMTGAPGARAFSLLVLLGVVLPQTLWYGELSLDWFQGRGFFSLLLGCLAAVMVPAVTLLRRPGVVAEWSSGLKQEGRRVLEAAVGMGWVGFGAMAFLEHVHQFNHPLRASMVALATIPVAALGMVGLYRQRAWGLVASAASVGGLAALVASMFAGGYHQGGGFMDLVVAAFAGSPVRTALSAALPVVLFASLLGPFLLGFWRKAAGQEPLSSGEASDAASQRLRVQPLRAPERRDVPARDEVSDDDALGEIEAESKGERKGRL